MDACPSVLYQNLIQDLKSQVNTSLVSIYKERRDFPVTRDAKLVAAISIARSLLKKWEAGSTDRLDSRAQLKFLECSKRAAEWRPGELASWELEFVGTIKQVLYEFWNPGGYELVSHPFDILREGDVGPGAAILGRGGDFYTKMFDSPLTHTDPYLYFWYRRYVAQFPEWDTAENQRYTTYGATLVKGNRLSFVPKNDETSRTICVEPTLNQYWQLGFSHILERRLGRFFGINLAVQQSKNRELARRGSISDGFCTIDLESASDSVSLAMVRFLFPAGFTRWLERLRSPETDVPGLGYRTEGMISTMGNGYTFALQTVIFSAVVVAAARMRGFKLHYPRGKEWGNFAVNGDDIIVPRELFSLVMSGLRLLGFTPNRDKTFAEGPFRESCGGDYFLGCPVRGVYVKTLKTEQDRYVVINLLNLFSARTGILLPRTVQYLLKTVRYSAVPWWEDAAAGLRVPFSLVHRPHVSKTQSVLYYAWVPKERKLRIGETAIVSPKRCRRRLYNPSGLLVAFLQRSVNSFSIGVRHDTVSWVRKRRVALNWEVTPSTWDGNPAPAISQTDRVADAATRCLDERCKTAVYMNFFM